MERVQGAAFSHQTKHFQILVPILKCVWSLLSSL